MLSASPLFVFGLLLVNEVHCWQALPEIPSGRRSQYLVLHENGGYKYGYDTGDGSAGKQAGDTANQVQGQYVYKSPSGQNIDIKYTAGVQGFVPEGLEKIQSGGYSYAAPQLQLPTPTQYSSPQNEISSNDQAGTGDASYSFSIDTDNYKRKEASDSLGNVQGSYSYTNGAGFHDLQYIAGENTGFVAKSGSLSVPNGLENLQGFGKSATPASTSLLLSPQTYSNNPVNPGAVSQVSQSGSGYMFSYSTGDSSRQESSDSEGNVQGRYSYQNGAGTHDLNYVAGAQTGFLPTGGSLSKANGLTSIPPFSSSSSSSSYSLPSISVKSQPTVASQDGSYSFGYDAGDHSQQESADSSGNVQGRYAYSDQAGSHDLSYRAGDSTGFIVTGGSLSQPNGLGQTGPVSPSSSASARLAQTYLPPSNLASVYLPPPTGLSGRYQDNEDNDGDDQSNTGDSSYSFKIDTPEYKRTESSDANGNVQGSFSYTNSAGNNDLSFVAGSDTGFLPTGGSLKTPPGLSETQFSTGASNRYQHAEKSILPYTNLPLIHSPPTSNSILPSTKSSYRLGNTLVNTYLPPSNEKGKFGYVFETT